MRLISFEHEGRAGYGIGVDAGVIDARRHLASPPENLRALLQTDGIPRLAAIADREPDFGYDAIRYRPVIDDPAAKLLCVGVNYLPHIREMGRERPDDPVIFTRFADSLVGHEEPMVRPRASQKYDFEGELAVIMGRRARHIAKRDALDYIAGYSCFNDGSIRDFQRHGLQWTPGKNFHHSGAFGPWLVTRDEQPDPAALHLTTTLNDEVVQDEKVSELCFDIGDLIAYITTWAELLPGDVIATGTPGGVGAGREPQLWMKAGDVVEVEIAGIGALRNVIVDEDAG
jgi:2-keto-4-pentenoate hydratase/2-oxohepta-3-ene-1,7-dioic acid hydratase in catechol pathway